MIWVWLIIYSGVCLFRVPLRLCSLPAPKNANYLKYVEEIGSQSDFGIVLGKSKNATRCRQCQYFVC